MDNIEKIVKEVMERLNTKESAYPLSENYSDSLKTKTGKDFNDITFEGVITGDVTHEDFKTDPDTLLMQADIADKAGKAQFAQNLRRAAELTNIPDDVILKVYDKLRPNRSSKQELILIADEFKNKYNAYKTAEFILETAEIYEKRNILKKE